MREIEFRGKKAIGASVWIYGYLFKRKNGNWYIATHQENDVILVENETVGQYTGLKDREETKIFEGDILRFIPDNHLYLVVFRSGEFIGELIGGKGFIPSLSFKNCAQVGNDRDNQDLLK